MIVNPQSLAMACNGQKFSVIYADPPWRYDRTPRGAAARHYATMTVDDSTCSVGQVSPPS